MEITAQDVINGYKTGEKSDEVRKFANHLYQEAIRITVNLNNSYHTPEEIIEIMSELTGKQIDGSFRMFPPCDCHQ